MRIKTLLAAAAATASLTLASTAGATNYSIYMHGMSLFAGCGNTPGAWCYWGGGQPGVNAVPLNYDGTAHLSQAVGTVKSTLDAYCMGSNWCYVGAHSEGGAMIGYAEALYPGRWNIYWVDLAGSAAGGSDLANAADWAIGSGVVGAICGACADLATGTVRGMYNHDALGDYIQGYVYAFMGGNWSSWDTCFFPGGGYACPSTPTGMFSGGGGNDRVIAYHSSGHYRQWGNDGSASANGAAGGAYWDYTITQYVDNESSGVYTHFTGGGIPNVIESDMSSYAK